MKEHIKEHIYDDNYFIIISKIRYKITYKFLNKVPYFT